jgi:dinuclear metal center YbgI/SA1388 family protein
MPDALADWVALVDAYYPERDAAAWDATGLQVGDPADPVAAVLVCLDVTEDTLAEAERRGADLVLSHHPLLFRPLPRLTPSTASGRLALRAARARIAVLAAHTNFDVAVPGTSHPVAAVLGLSEVAPLVPQPEDPAAGLGLVGNLSPPRPLGEIAAALAAGLPSPHLRVAGDLDRAVRRVAACGGAGGSLVDAAHASGADVFVTGDLRHHVALDALALGLALVDAGHYATEAPALPALLDALAAGARGRGLTARLLASEIRTDPWKVPPGAAELPGAPGGAA